jgi:hypothetical protein
MAMYSHRVRWLKASAQPRLSYREWSALLRGSVRRAVVQARTTVGQLARRLGRVTPDQWFLLGFVVLFFLFLIILLVQPTSVGRGGR